MTTKYFNLLLLSLLTVLMTACKPSDSFSIKGTIVGNPDMNVTLTYYGNDAVNSIITVARKGEFEVKCAAKSPALVSIRDNSGKLMGVIYAEPGDKITCTIDRNNPFRIKAEGNALSQRWSAVADSLAESLLRLPPEEVNAIVERYIATHPGDETSALLFVQCYDSSKNPFRADSVLRSISPEAQNAVMLDSYVTQARHYSDSAALRPVRELVMRTLTDSAYRFRASRGEINVIAFTGDRRDRLYDSVRTVMRRLHLNRKVQVLNLSLASDTFIWQRIAKLDSIDCPHGWLPGGTLAPQVSRLGIPTLPYFIVTDSTGRQLLRTASATTAEDFVNARK